MWPLRKYPRALKERYDEVSTAIAQRLRQIAAGREPIVVCIGTDRSTGDSLGPLVGMILKSKGFPHTVLGTIDEPITADKLATPGFLKDVEEAQAAGKLVIAVDACLGMPEDVGKISLTEAPLKPGAGVNKILPEVGEVRLEGIVNASGYSSYMDYLALCSTRLSLVWKMANCIASQLMLAFGQDSKVCDLSA